MIFPSISGRFRLPALFLSAGVMIAVFGLVAAPALQAQKSKAKPKPEPEVVEEPPLEFTLEADGKPIPVKLDAPFDIPGGGKTISARLTVKPYRQFQHSGVRFRYPNYYAFEGETDTPGVVMWTLSGDDNTLMLFKYAREDSESTLKTTTDAAIEQHGKKNVRQGQCSLKLAEQTIQGKRLDITPAPDVFIRQDVYAFTSENASFILIVQDAPDEGKKMTEETSAAIKMLQESFEFSGTAATPAAKAAKKKK